MQQAHKEDGSLSPPSPLGPASWSARKAATWKATTEKRAAIFIGPEFGTVQRADLVAAAREAGDAGFDVLIACAFNYEAHATEFSKLGRIPVLKARMNADLHMADDLKNTGKGNLFVIFGEPDITLLPETDGKLRVKVNGVDVFKPQTGEVHQRQRRRHRLLVRRHRLQRGELLRPSRLFPWRQRSVQCAEDHAEGRDRRGSMGDAP